MIVYEQRATEKIARKLSLNLLITTSIHQPQHLGLEQQVLIYFLYFLTTKNNASP